MTLEQFAIKEPQAEKKTAAPALPSLSAVASAVAEGKLKRGSVIEFEVGEGDDKKTLRWKLNLPRKLWVTVSDKPRTPRKTAAQKAAEEAAAAKAAEGKK